MTKEEEDLVITEYIVVFTADLYHILYQSFTNISFIFGKDVPIEIFISTFLFTKY